MSGGWSIFPVKLTLIMWCDGVAFEEHNVLMVCWCILYLVCSKWARKVEFISISLLLNASDYCELNLLILLMGSLEIRIWSFCGLDTTTHVPLTIPLHTSSTSFSCFSLTHVLLVYKLFMKTFHQQLSI